MRLIAFLFLAGVLAATGETVYDGAVETDVAAWNAATATKLNVAANDTVTITNGVFELLNGDPAFGTASTFRIMAGAELYATNAARTFALSADNSRILLDGGYLEANVHDKYGLFSGTPKNCRWDLVNGSTVDMTGTYAYPQMSGSNNVVCVVNSTNLFASSSGTHKARSMKFYKAEDCAWAFTNSHVRSFCIGFGNSNEDTSTYNAAYYNGYARRNRLIFHDSTVSLYNTARGLHFGARNITNQSFSNRVEVTGTSGKLTLSRLQMRGYADVFRMEGSTVNLAGWNNGGIFMTGEYNRFENAGGTLTIGSNGVQLSNHGNVFENCGGTLSAATSLGGVSNRVELSAGTISGAVTLNGTTNAYVQTGGTASGATTINGTNCVFKLSGGLFNAALTMKGVSNTYEHVGGISTGNVTVAGFGNTLHFKGGTHWGQYRGALVFSENTTNNTVVIDDAEFIHHGTFGKSYASKVGWPYTNCPNCAIEFRGTTPKFRVTSSLQGVNSEPYHTVNLGKGTEPMQDPVRLRYILPATPYATAPFRSEVTSRWIVLDGNAVIEVDDSNLPSRHSKMRYPLIYDKYSFHNDGSAVNVDSLNTVNHALGTLGENMTLVRSGTTLYVDVYSYSGTMIYFR